MTIPKKITAGDAIEWVESSGDYPSPDWSISYVLINGLGKIEIPSAPDTESDGHFFDIPSTTSDSYQPGDYAYQRYAKKGDKRKTIGRGFVTIEFDFGAGEKHDATLWLDRAIEALEQSLAKSASSNMLAMDIDGSRIEHKTDTEKRETLEWLYKRRVARQRARDMAQGKSPFGTVRVGF